MSSKCCEKTDCSSNNINVKRVTGKNMMHMKIRHPKSFKLLQLFFAECLGTFILLFIGCMSSVAATAPPSNLEVSFGFGFAMIAAVHIFGPISKCHVNPMLTLAALIIGKIDLQRALVYCVAQFIGAILGYATLYFLTPWNYLLSQSEPDGDDVVRKLVCVPLVNPDINIWSAVAIESLGTFILVLLAASCWDVRNRSKSDGAGARFSFAFTGLVLATMRYSSANLNPARSLAPAIFSLDFEHQWVFWLGPVVGSIFGAVVYRFLFDIRQEDGDTF